MALIAARRYLLMIGMFILPCSWMRIALARLCGVRIGKQCWIGFNVEFDTNHPGLITIEDQVTVSHRTMIYTHTASPCASPLAARYRARKPVLIKKGAWIGAGAILVPGAVIERNCFIAAGAVVAGTTESESLFAGNPARLIKRLTLEKK